MHDHPEGEIGKRTLWLVTWLVDDDLGQALLAYQHGLQVLQHQRQKAQCGIQAGIKRRLCHARAAQESQAAAGQAAGVHGEELIIAAPCQQTPETRIGIGTHARIRPL
ncbi:hypothetical protein D3C76_1296650 [compost metagenome]